MRISRIFAKGDGEEKEPLKIIQHYLLNTGSRREKETDTLLMARASPPFGNIPAASIIQLSCFIALASIGRPSASTLRCDRRRRLNLPWLPRSSHWTGQLDPGPLCKLRPGISNGRTRRMRKGIHP